MPLVVVVIEFGNILEAVEVRLLMSIVEAARD